jgi:membrane protein implicated in regulation of membrane protease activity
MSRHTIIEVLHIVIGLGATALIVWGSSWAYPLARWEIEVTGIACAVVVVLLGIGPVRRAWARDRGRQSTTVSHG